MRALIFLLPLVIGCSAPEYSRPAWGGGGEPWDTTWLIDADPAGVDLGVVATSLEAHYWDFAQLEGVCLEPARSDPASGVLDSFDTGGDSGLFTGTALACWAFKYGVTKDVAETEPRAGLAVLSRLTLRRRAGRNQPFLE